MNESTFIGSTTEPIGMPDDMPTTFTDSAD